MNKKALITGITGQDGSYLAELLLGKGYEVHGLIRRASTFNTERIDHLYKDTHESDNRLFLHYGDLSDSGQLTNIIYNIQPDEIYNLAAQSHVRVSFDLPMKKIFATRNHKIDALELRSRPQEAPLSGGDSRFCWLRSSGHCACIY